MKIQTIRKSYTQKDGTVWKWVEPPELREFILQVQSKTKQESLNES